MSTNNNQSSEPMTKKRFTEIFWNNFESALRERNMSHREFAQKVNMNEKTLCSMIARKSCPDIWFMAMTKEVLRYDCTQMLYHYNSLANTKALTEKELAVLKMIRQGDKEDQDRKLDVITAFLRYATGDNRILGKAIPDNMAPSMIGDFDNSSTRRRTNRRRNTPTAQPESTPVAEPTPAPVSASRTEPAPVISETTSSSQSNTRSRRRNKVVDNPNQIYFDFSNNSDDGENNS